MAITYIEILQIYRSHEDKPANRKKNEAILLYKKCTTLIRIYGA